MAKPALGYRRRRRWYQTLLCKQGLPSRSYAGLDQQLTAAVLMHDLKSIFQVSCVQHLTRKPAWRTAAR
jgi:hypothetical protein